MRNYFNKRKLRLTLLLLLMGSLLVFGGCSNSNNEAGSPSEGDKDKPTLVFADAGWDSIHFHNEVAQFIIEKGYGYKTDTLPGSTPVTFMGLANGDIDIYMEVWTQNIIDQYEEAIEKGEVIDLSINFDDNAQGLYVPTYMIKGDSSRGIEATTPDLKSIEDLPKYWEVFKDPEDPKKGRIIGSPPGWAADEILGAQIKTFNLDETYNYFHPGSDAALSASITKAYETGKPWVGYYWDPTWIMGKYDMTLLSAPAFDQEKWDENYGCEFPAVKVTVGVNSSLPEKAPDVVEFLKEYKTSTALTSEALAYMQNNNVKSDKAAQWFLKEKEDVWLKWVPAEIAEKVKAALN